ncbi:unnamed protein product [Sphenostylis stenocarpa]|uniref:Uncharacterized protein n=1 Tax=Sphenostylis stenocarpa TaxID=92480 RepID=A0AA86VRK6_9FABA|nr:unnamed protein product [Sphenostylis stenocarpa]
MAMTDLTALSSMLNVGCVLPDNNTTMADLNVLSSMIEHNLNNITKRLETLNVIEKTQNQPHMQTPLLAIHNDQE